MTFPNGDECENHLKSCNHSTDKAEDQSEEMDVSKDSEIHCVFCSKSFDSIDKVEIHVAECHTAEEPESNDFLIQNSTKDIKLEHLLKFDKSNFHFSQISENNFGSRN